jgi:phage baseplate assembly protein W
MARVVTSEYQKHSVYSDVDMSLEIQSDGDITRDIDVEAIKNSIVNIITTVPGERRMLPTFAFGVYNLLFEPMNDEVAQKIGNNILSAIQTWEDRIKIDTVTVITDYDRNRYNIVVDFTMKGMGSQVVYSVDTILRAQ